MGGSHLREVVAHGGSTVIVLNPLSGRLETVSVIPQSRLFTVKKIILKSLVYHL